MISEKIIISERQIRGVVRKILLEVHLVDEYLLGNKFSFSEEGDPAFVVVAENISTGQSLISRYSQMSLNDFVSGIKTLSGPSESGAPETPSSDLLSKISLEQDGWKVWEEFKSNLANLRSQKGDLVLINKISRNFKAPSKISTKSGQEKFSKFECTLRVDEVAKNLFSWPNSQEFMMAAACSYSYANSWRALALSAAIGAIIGGYAAGTASAAAGAVATAPVGGEGAVPAGALGVLGGAMTGAGIGAASSDAALRLPPMLWALSNKNYIFAAANAIVIFLDLFTFGKGSAAAEAAKKTPILLKGVKGIVQLVFEFIAPMAADAAIQVEKDKFTQALQDLIDGKVGIETTLNQSEEALKTAIRFQYPDF